VESCSNYKPLKSESIIPIKNNENAVKLSTSYFHFTRTLLITVTVDIIQEVLAWPTADFVSNTVLINHVNR